MIAFTIFSMAAWSCLSPLTYLAKYPRGVAG